MPGVVQLKTLIHTWLQPGDQSDQLTLLSRFTGFLPKPLETVLGIKLVRITWLKPGVNERVFAAHSNAI